MDTRGAAALDDPAGALDLLREQRELEVPNILEARRASAHLLDEVKTALGDAPVHTGVPTCLFGSWARQELTEGSDHDWAVVVADSFGTHEPTVTREVDAASRHLGQDERYAPRFDPFVETPLPAQRPRPLWRTICVDFEGKAAQGTDGGDPKWATRNAKLRTSRKLLFVGGLVSVLLCHHLDGVEDMQSFLIRWLDAPPLDRLAAAFLHASEAERGVLETAVRTFDARFVGSVP